MRSLSDTGADKVFLAGLSHHDGAVLIITKCPAIEQSQEYGKLVVSFEALDESTRETNTYYGGSARLIGQATMLRSSWNGDAVRVRVATKLNSYGKRTAWLEEAPPAMPQITKPIYSEQEQAARARARELVELHHVPVATMREWTRTFSDEMGKIDYPRLLSFIEQHVAQLAEAAKAQAS